MLRECVSAVGVLGRTSVGPAKVSKTPTSIHGWLTAKKDRSKDVTSTGSSTLREVGDEIKIRT